VRALEAWQNFYVIVGSAAGALTGLQFVVAALVADIGDNRAFTGSSGAFATPTVVHFSVVLVLSGVLAAPWTALGAPMIVIGVGGAAGIAYSIVVGRRACRQGHYTPVMEDWLFHVYIPAGAYLTMAIAACASRVHTQAGLFAVATSALLLLIVGIHNAWDSVTYIVANRGRAE
jgi:hypothetical protein